MKNKHLLIIVIILGIIVALMGIGNIIKLNYNDDNEKDIKKEFLTVSSIIEDSSIKQKISKINIQISNNNEYPIQLTLLPKRLNGVACETISYKNYINEYNSIYDAIVPSLEKDTQIKINSEIIKNVKNIKCDSEDTIFDVNWEKEEDVYKFNLQRTGIYIMECEFNDNSEGILIFQCSVI